MRSNHKLVGMETTFDEDNLLPNGGLAVPAALAQRLGVAELIDQRVCLPADAAGRAASGAKAMTVIGAMLTGADSIDDVAVLRAGAAAEVFDDTRAPSTVGTWLRGFGWGTVRQLDAASRGLLARAWDAGLGPDLDADLTVDLDSTICQAYGTAKQGVRFGYTGVRGLHPLVATLEGTDEVVHSRMRGGNAGAARGADSFTRETIARIRDAGATGQLTMRADSAFYGRPFVHACLDHDVDFSVTVGTDDAISKAIAAIPADAWTPIPYWLEGGADVAEIEYTAFKKPRRDAVTGRLIVRRVRPTPGSQLALDVVYDYHAVFTNRTGDMLDIEAEHRRHAVVELTIRDLKAGGLAHVPSGVFFANAAWLGLAVIAHNLGRWTLHSAGGQWARATVATLRRKLISMPARLVHTARKLKLRAPTDWPWADAYRAAMARIAAIPAPP